MKRFSLQAMLIVATLLAIYFGFSQHRRRAILSECEALKAEQVQFVLPDSLTDKFWQRAPTNIVVTANVHGGLDTPDEKGASSP